MIQMAGWWLFTQIKFICVTWNHKDSFSFIWKLAGLSDCLFKFFFSIYLAVFIHSQLKSGLKAALGLEVSGSTINLGQQLLCWSLAEKPLLQRIQALIQNVGYKAGRAAVSYISYRHSDEVTSLISLLVNIHWPSGCSRSELRWPWVRSSLNYFEVIWLQAFRGYRTGVLKEENKAQIFRKSNIHSFIHAICFLWRFLSSFIWCDKYLKIMNKLQIFDCFLGDTCKDKNPNPWIL